LKDFIKQRQMHMFSFQAVIVIEPLGVDQRGTAFAVLVRIFSPCSRFTSAIHSGNTRAFIAA
jgi:hypothetical protein